MDKADIKIKHGYGIGSLEHSFIFDGNAKYPRQNTHIVYAQNGVMKSSFAKTLNDYSKGLKIKDHIFDTDGLCEINDGAATIEPERIFSVASFDNGEFESQRLGNLLVSTRLQEEYQNLMDKFKVAYFELMQKIKEVSGVSSKDDYDSILDQICGQYGENVPRTPYGLINILISNRIEIEKRPDFIQKTRITVSGGKDAIKFAQDNKGVIKELMEIYEEIKKTASFVRGKFDSGNAGKLVDVVTKTGFLDVEHELVLLNKSTGKPEAVRSVDDLKDKLATDIDKILAQKPALKTKFNKMIKDLSTDTRTEFKKMLEDTETKDIILLMNNPTLYVRILWEGYLKACLVEADELIRVQAEIKGEVERITEEAKLERTDWDDVVRKFNKRFRNLPYEIGIENKASVILEGVEAPRPVITYKRGVTTKNFKTPKEREGIARLLSTGERKALYLLNVMFEIEATQKDKKPCLIVLDDVVDSFDYKNKYAFLEYIYDVSTNYSNIRLITLTHNYDFFRLLQSRLFGDKYRERAWFARSDDGNVKLEKAEYFRLFTTMRSRAQTDETIWLAMIPFARNLNEYRCDDVSTSANYELLTNCLHDQDVHPSVKDIRDVLQDEIGITKSPFKDTDTFHDILISAADKLLGEKVTEINLHYNLVFAMAARIYAERYMKSKLPASSVDEAKASKSVFTRKLYELLVDGEIDTEENLEKLDEVNLVTPEHIHVNAFMYEPLLDISFDEVKELYVSIKELATT